MQPSGKTAPILSNCFAFMYLSLSWENMYKVQDDRKWGQKERPFSFDPCGLVCSLKSMIGSNLYQFFIGPFSGAKKWIE